MIDMEKLQALKMTAKDDHLFIEAGGFNEKNPSVGNRRSSS